MRPAPFRAAVVSVVLAATLAGATAAQAVPPPDHNCIFEGVNLNEAHGVTERIIGPPPCREAFAGERWVRPGPGWETAPDAESAVYPDGYNAPEADPIDDFNAKFRGARYVIDRGTAQERTFTYGPEILQTGFVGENGRPFSVPVSPPFRPLSVGEHTVVVFVRLSGEHCDGLGTDPELNCLPEGEFQWTGDTPFRVFPRSA
ncbi:hypothetical protein OHT76_33560 [Streptomyces sp. NBC_00287]|uniref:hypothetical protein n=1 Tax=Streptomyces sp. NBC_00287 TaxID=2975702 RepID=UPI002E28A1AA|nr:hypothetical protein [Streptomyces sp. NBC_00287]